MSKCLTCPECGLVWDDDPEVNDASHCDCGYPIDKIFLGLRDCVEYGQPGNTNTTDYSRFSGLGGQRYGIKDAPPL